jgi:hypothetical protein
VQGDALSAPVRASMTIKGPAASADATTSVARNGSSSDN